MWDTSLPTRETGDNQPCKRTIRRAKRSGGDARQKREKYEGKFQRSATPRTNRTNGSSPTTACPKNGNEPMPRPSMSIQFFVGRGFVQRKYRRNAFGATPSARNVKSRIRKGIPTRRRDYASQASRNVRLQGGSSTFLRSAKTANPFVALTIVDCRNGCGMMKWSNCPRILLGGGQGPMIPSWRSTNRI